MLPGAREEFLHKKVERFDRLMKYTGIGALISIAGLLTFVIVLQYQTQAQITQNLVDLKAAAKINHDETRSYFRCIADALTQPLATRENAFDQCGINVDGTEQTPATDPTQSSAVVPSVIPQSQPVARTEPQQVTTSAPPDPTPSPSTSTPAATGQKDTLHAIPVVGNLLDFLKL